MASTIKIRTSVKDNTANVRCIIRHPMETGFRIDSETNQPIPFHFIKHVFCYHKDELILECDWSRAVSRNPYLEFEFEGAEVGDELLIKWIDTKDKEDSIIINLK